MTDDTSPENLRKFLESDDPAMVRMGLSMAKGAGVEVTIKDLEHFLKSEDVETIKTGIMLADEAGIGDEVMEMLCEALGDEDDDVRQDAVYALGMIGDARAVEPLMSNLGVDAVGTPDEHYWVIGEAIIAALGSIGDARAIQPLFEILEEDILRLADMYIGGEVQSDDGYYYRNGEHAFMCQEIVDAIIQIGSRKAIEPLLAALDSGIESQNWWLPGLAAETLTGLGWKPETDEQQASYLIATKDWEGCKKTGEPVVTKAVLYLAHPIYAYERTGIFNQIMRAVDSFGETMIRIFKDNLDSTDVEGVAEALEILGHEVE